MASGDVSIAPRAPPAAQALADQVCDALLAIAVLNREISEGCWGFSRGVPDGAWIATRFRTADETLARFWAAIVADGSGIAAPDDAETALRMRAQDNADADTPDLRADVATSYRRATGY